MKLDTEATCVYMVKTCLENMYILHVQNVYMCLGQVLVRRSKYSLLLLLLLFKHAKSYVFKHAKRSEGHFKDPVVHVRLRWIIETPN